MEPDQAHLEPTAPRAQRPRRIYFTIQLFSLALADSICIIIAQSVSELRYFEDWADWMVWQVTPWRHLPRTWTATADIVIPSTEHLPFAYSDLVDQLFPFVALEIIFFTIMIIIGVGGLALAVTLLYRWLGLPRYWQDVGSARLVGQIVLRSLFHAGWSLALITFISGFQEHVTRSISSLPVAWIAPGFHTDSLLLCISLTQLVLTAAVVRHAIIARIATTGRRCDACGYLLHGLRENRCPECGRTFDHTQQPQMRLLLPLRWRLLRHPAMHYGLALVPLLLYPCVIFLPTPPNAIQRLLWKWHLRYNCIEYDALPMVPDCLYRVNQPGGYHLLRARRVDGNDVVITYMSWDTSSAAQALLIVAGERRVTSCRDKNCWIEMGSGAGLSVNLPWSTNYALNRPTKQLMPYWVWLNWTPPSVRLATPEETAQLETFSADKP